ncbi:lymphocyte-specific helicase-like isoform X2 [Clytia hemisphaerica]|uniref:Proliferation-associated SNF2-like protein n=1 Tax=Clytia hemisphaerica TaxID=252671 RepID=A0A7M5XHE1_9CNID
MGETIERVNQPKEKELICTKFPAGKVECTNDSSTDSEDAQIVPDVDHSPSKQIKDDHKEDVSSPEGNVEMYNMKCDEKVPTKDCKNEQVNLSKNIVTSKDHQEKDCGLKNTDVKGQDFEQPIDSSDKSKELNSKNTSNETSNTDNISSKNLLNVTASDIANNSSEGMDKKPEETSSKQGNVNEDAVKAEPKFGLTVEMIEEEEKLKQEQEKQLDEIKNKALQELNSTGQKQRFDRLQVLLSRSQMYSTYILGRLNSRREAEKKRLERVDKNEKKKKEFENKESDPKNETQDKEEKDSKADGESKFSRGKRKRKSLPKDEQTSQKPKKSRVNNKKEEAKSAIEKAMEKNKKAPVDTKLRDQLYYNRTIKDQPVPPQQPLLLTGGILRNYQLEGMTWLLGLFEHGINGILADEMGLGKTLQSISLIVSLIERDVKGPFLLAAPLSTLPNWVAEFEKFAPEIYTILYHGSIPERTELRRKMMRIKRYSHGFVSLPVIISSYEILMRDRQLLETYNIEWKFLIVDEGHRIKNLNCRLIKELKLYKTANRLLLTGTPLQNNLSELWSLLNFLLPDIFDDLNSFQTWFDFGAITDGGEDNEKLIEQENKDSVLQTLHSILTPFLLRRLKTDVDLTIPPKKEVYVYAPLTEKQQVFYRTTLDRTIMDMLEKNKKKQEEPVEYTASGRVKRKTASNITYKEEDDSQDIDIDLLFEQMEEQERKKQEQELLMKQKLKPKSLVNIKMQNTMMQLRKCCNHPYLLEYPFNPDNNELVINEDLVKVSGKMLVLDQMLPALRKRGHKVLIFSQMTTMLDIIGDYCGIRGYKYSRIDGTMGIKDRQQMIEDFAADEETFLFLLSTRAGGLGLNLMMADTCIIYDSDWNPQVDLQAQDRCHRIGQTRPVIIYRFVTANTIDQRIIERASSKRKLEKMIIHKKNFKGQSATAISPSELLDLLKSNDFSSSVDTGGHVFTNEQLDRLLDRSDMMPGSSSPDDVGDQKKANVSHENDENNNNDISGNQNFKVFDITHGEKVEF